MSKKLPDAITELIRVLYAQGHSIAGIQARVWEVHARRVAVKTIKSMLPTRIIR